MARSRSSSKRTKRRLAYIIPIIGVAAVLLLYVVAVALPQPPPAMDFVVNISIQYTRGNSSNNTVQFLPPPAVGEPGGIWYDHQLDGFGVNRHYPVYTDSPPAGNYSGFSVIHVRSKVMYPYTLGDYFNVWGEPLSMNDTYNIRAGQIQGEFWSMCIGLSISSLTPGNWGQQALTPNLNILLIYSVENNCINSGA